MLNQKYETVYNFHQIPLSSIFQPYVTMAKKYVHLKI